MVCQCSMGVEVVLIDRATNEVRLMFARRVPCFLAPANPVDC